MGARQKLNCEYLTGSLILAALFGWASGSWLVFSICLAVLIVAHCASGNIRAHQDDGWSRVPIGTL